MTDKITVTRISEYKYLVGKNSTSLIESNIIHIVTNGEQTDELAIVQREINSKLAAKVENKINYLIDLNNCGKNSPKARNIWRDLTDDENTHKVALFGMHPVARVMAAFVMKITKKDNQQFFKTKQEAIKWLSQ